MDGDLHSNFSEMIAAASWGLNPSPHVKMSRCGVPILRPGMDANVGLGDGNNAGNALWRELVESVPYDCGTCGLGSFKKGLLDVIEIIQQIRPALLKLQDQVYSERIQSPPLLTYLARRPNPNYTMGESERNPRPARREYDNPPFHALHASSPAGVLVHTHRSRHGSLAWPPPTRPSAPRA